jgi:hypothetical protein
MFPRDGEKMRSTILSGALSLLFFVATGAYAQNIYLPQVVNGDFGNVRYRTTFIIFNNSDVPANSLLTLTDDLANPMTVTLGGFGTASQFSIDLAPGGTGFLQTDGLGPGSVGAATLASTAPVGFSAFYTVYDNSGKFLTQSGVEPSSLMTDFVLPVDCLGPYLTGLALFNPGASAIIKLTLQNPDGSQAMYAEIPLDAGGHTAFFVSGLSPLFPNLSNFRGTLLVQSTSPISALALRQYNDSSILCFTSLPVTPQSSSDISLNLAQVANGSVGSINYRTSFHIFNVSQTQANVRLTLTTDNGSPFIVRITGSGPGTGTGSSFNFNLPIGGSVFLETDGLGPGASGAATVASNVPVGAAAIFTVLDSQGNFQTEAGVGDSQVFSSLTVPVEVDGNTNTGIALFNPTNTAIALAINLLDANGVLIGTTNIPLKASGHYAAFIDQIFPGIGNMKGSFAISSTGGVASTILRQFGPPSSINYTTFVAYGGIATGKVPMTALLAKEVTDINAIAGDPDVSYSAVLSPGSTLSGTLSGAGPGLEVIADSGGGHLYIAPVNPLTGYYSLILPPATYRLSTVYNPNGSPSGLTLVLTYLDPIPVNVPAAGSVRNMVLPAPILVDVSGTISGSGNLPLVGSQVVFTSGDNTTQGSFPIDGNGNYAGALPAGTYSVSAGDIPIAFNTLQFENLNLFKIGSLTVGTGAVTANYAIPPTATLSGAVSAGPFFSLPLGSSVLATDTLATPASPTACCAPPTTSASSTDSSGMYQMILAQSRSFTVGITVPMNMGPGLTAAFDYPINANSVKLDVNSTLGLNIPVLPSRAVIFGNVNDGNGHVLPNVTVTAYSQAISGAPNMDFYVSGKTDIYGNYSLLVLSGNYRLSFVPPSQ